ncbi:hypothetical protein [Vibrio harveyi]|uniref:hypothetical protein n=1 Tax=Vibrio harveyi TaxID=669 RepID=UPI003CF3F556
MKIRNYEDLVDLGFIRNSCEFSEVYRFMGRMHRRGFTLRVFSFSLPLVALWFATQVRWDYDSALIGFMLAMVVVLLSWLIYTWSSLAYKAEAEALCILRNYSDRFAANKLEERLNTTKSKA